MWNGFSELEKSEIWDRYEAARRSARPHILINSLVFGFLFGSHIFWAIFIGWLPGVLLLVGLRIRNDHRGAATVLITVSSIAAAVAFWMIYPVVLALVVIVGGFSTGMLGPRQAESVVA